MPNATSPLTRRGLLAAAGVLALGASAVQAHHGWSGYLDEDFVLTGVVKALHFGGAHDRIEVENGEGVWDVMLGPPFRNRRNGVTEDMIPIGAEITAEGHRHRDPERLEVKAERLRLGDKVLEVYPERL